MAPHQKPLRIVHVTTVHRPFDVRIFHKQCITLAKAGHSVALVQQGDDPETRDGVEIVPLPRTGGRAARMTRGVWQAVKRVRNLEPDVVHFHDVEFIWGALLLKIGGHRIVYDVHEDVIKDLEDKRYLPRWAIPPLRIAVSLFERLAELSFDRIVPATSSIAKRFPNDRTHLIRNTPILGEMDDPDAPPFSGRPRAVGYLGGLAAFNGPREMVAAMGGIAPAADATLIMGGRFPEPDIEVETRAMPGWRRVDFRGWVDRTEIRKIFGSLRAGLVVYQPTPNVMVSEPNKFFEFLSAGIPLIASNFPVWRDFVETHRCGICVDPTNPQAIAEAIVHLLDHPHEAEEMGRRGRDLVLKDFNWQIDAERLLAMYDDLGDKSPTAVD